MSTPPSQREVKEDTRKDGEKQVDGSPLAIMATLIEETYFLSGIQLCLFVYPSILTSFFPQFFLPQPVQLDVDIFCPLHPHSPLPPFWC